MLSDNQNNLFRQAVDYWNGDVDGSLDNPYISSIDKVVETRETIADFQRSMGIPGRVEETPFGTFRMWEGVQKAKGLRRGTMFVMDFPMANARACYFDGETE